MQRHLLSKLNQIGEENTFCGLVRNQISGRGRLERRNPRRTEIPLVVLCQSRGFRLQHYISGQSVINGELDPNCQYTLSSDFLQL